MALRVSNEQSQWLSTEAEPCAGAGAAPPSPSIAGAASDSLEAYAGSEAAAGGRTIAGGAREYESPLFLRSKSDREQLAMAPQVNEVSNAAGNANRVCAGAAVVNAMILASTDARACKANSAALAASAKALGAARYLPECVKQTDVDTALRALASGSVRPSDVSVLQQLAYAMARAIQGGHDTGTSPGAMAVVVAQLLGAGAQLADTKFTLIEDRERHAHWVASTNGTLANSLGDGTVDTAAVAEKALAPFWSAEVTVPQPGKRGADATVQAKMRGGGAIDRTAGTLYRFHLDPADFRGNKAPDLVAIDRQLRKEIADHAESIH